MKKVLCAIIIIGGMSLETYFYAYRFQADGLPPQIDVVLGFMLELLLAFTVYSARRKKAYAVIAVLITCYAVLQTSAGQTFALLSHNVSVGTVTANATADFTIAECKKTVARLSNEADTINAQLRSLQSTEARANYAGTIYNATQRLNVIAAEKARNMDILLKTSTSTVNEARTGEVKKSIYVFYASVPSWKGDDWLKFIFHFILSVFIAIMAPVGILAWNTERYDTIDATFTKQQIEMFVTAVWFRIRNNTSASILSEVEYNNLLQKKGIPVVTGLYFMLSNRCIQLGLVNTSGVAIERDYQKVIKALSGEKEKFIARFKRWSCGRSLISYLKKIKLMQ